MIALRDLQVSDRAQLLEWRNLPEVARWMYTDHPILAKEHDRWFDGIAGDPRRKYWVVTRDGVDAGLLNLADIDSKHRRCEFGIYIATPQSRSQGSGTAALSMALTYAFEELNLNKVSAEAFATNIVAIQVYERLGLRREACLRDHVAKDGEMHDVVRLAILREDWRVVRPAIEDGLRAKGLIA